MEQKNERGKKNKRTKNEGDKKEQKNGRMRKKEMKWE